MLKANIRLVTELFMKDLDICVLQNEPIGLMTLPFYQVIELEGKVSNLQACGANTGDSPKNVIHLRRTLIWLDPFFITKNNASDGQQHCAAPRPCVEKHSSWTKHERLLVRHWKCISTVSCAKERGMLAIPMFHHKVYSGAESWIDATKYPMELWGVATLALLFSSIA